jgi:hypothetical protein
MLTGPVIPLELRPQDGQFEGEGRTDDARAGGTGGPLQPLPSRW